MFVTGHLIMVFGVYCDCVPKFTCIAAMIYSINSAIHPAVNLSIKTERDFNDVRKVKPT
jgi:hypothetical protein